MSAQPHWCPVQRPTTEEFQKPFLEYINGVFGADPSLPCFKVVPPVGWKPRKTPFPDLRNVIINTPIRQHCYGSKGVYRCLLVEHKSLSVSDFKALTLAEVDKVLGRKGQAGSAADPEAALAEDELNERNFWSSVMINPPLYGADTPVSFFDKSLSWGWNLSKLGDLLNHKNVPEIPGVTTPMTYFGMWRSFFGWHKEDCDLLSINYLHFGAPKVWYVVSPEHMDKFDRMCHNLYPECFKACAAFVRHKDILISPTVLRAHSVPFMQVKQMPGEFVVLNSAAYHAGFNMGFNCAEAINFASEAWIPHGKLANRCTCDTLKDCVRMDMKLFDPDWEEPYQDAEGTVLRRWPHAGRVQAVDATNRFFTSGLIRQLQQQRALREQGVSTPGLADTESKGQDPWQEDSDEETDQLEGQEPVAEHGEELASPDVVRTPAQVQDEEGRKRQHALSDSVAKRLRSGSEGGAKRSASPILNEATLDAESRQILHNARQHYLQRSASGKNTPAEFTDISSSSAAAAAAVSSPASVAGQRPRRSCVTTSAPAALVTTAVGAPDSRSALPKVMEAGGVTSWPVQVQVTSAIARQLLQDKVVEPPSAIVEEDASGDLSFHLVQRLQRSSKRSRHVIVRALVEGPNGLFYPSNRVWEEKASVLATVRVQVMNASPDNSLPDGLLPVYKLLTLRSRLLEMD